MKRKYDSPIRRQQAAETRERIVTAGAELLHGFPIWNWRALTIRAVADRAGITERTVYRYFASERALRDAILERLEQESGVELDGLRLEDLTEVTSRILSYSSEFPIATRTERDATVAAANERQRDALLAAVKRATKGWSTTDRMIAAAMFDVLWSPVNLERLVIDWELDPKEAIRGITWVVSVVEDAIRENRKPG